MQGRLNQDVSYQNDVLLQHICCRIMLSPTKDEGAAVKPDYHLLQAGICTLHSTFGKHVEVQAVLRTDHHRGVVDRILEHYRSWVCGC